MKHVGLGEVLVVRVPLVARRPDVIGRNRRHARQEIGRVGAVVERGGRDDRPARAVPVRGSGDLECRIADRPDVVRGDRGDSQGEVEAAGG